ncbi:prephenate dehydratase [Corynebacterium jeikeium]|uniref:prephenate dehydratase n=1 Tax=Corynebacterium jeikeium TaxID=38289 RepID=UPI000888C23F|nr:prephenate dehydratase [Corynebacterium jeikeium]SCX00581.1 Prephenate dehydratase [Corynebacterium jeikeium]
MSKSSGHDTSGRVAFLGPEGTFTEEALKQFKQLGAVPEEATEIPVTSPRMALDMVRDGEADYACVALESSVDGPVSQTEDALTYGKPLQIYREVLVPVVFSILVRPGTKLEDIKTLTTHPVAEAQVRNWVAENLPDVTFVPASSNGAAAAAVKAGEADAAAAPARAGEIHQLEALAEGVADVAGAQTRFILVGNPGKPPERSGNDRSGMVLWLPNVPSSLLDAIAELSTRQVDMARIGSRPRRTGEKGEGAANGNYVFHIGIVGHIEDAAVAEALAGLYRRAEDVRFLGSWPSAEALPVVEASITHPLHRHAGSAPPNYAESSRWIEELKSGQRGS